MSTDFIKIPMTIENPISPSLYSFLMGLKNVCASCEREKKLKNALFTDEKYEIRKMGAS